MSWPFLSFFCLLEIWGTKTGCFFLVFPRNHQKNPRNPFFFAPWTLHRRFAASPAQAAEELFGLLCAAKAEPDLVTFSSLVKAESGERCSEDRGGGGEEVFVWFVWFVVWFLFGLFVWFVVCLVCLFGFCLFFVCLVFVCFLFVFFCLFVPEVFNYGFLGFWFDCVFFLSWGESFLRRVGSGLGVPNVEVFRTFAQQDL